MSKPVGLPPGLFRLLAGLLLLGSLVLLCVPTTRALDVPPLRGHVNDAAGVLSSAEQSALEQRLAAHEQATSQQFVLLTVPTLGGEPIENFSIEVVEAWKLGSKKQDDGLLMLVVPQDRKMRIEVGDGLEGVITDVLSSRVQREVLQPAFRANDFAGGINTAFGVLMAQGRGEPNAMPKAPAQHRGVSPGLLIFVVFFLFILLSNRFGGGGRGGRRRGGYYGGFGGFGGGGFGGGFGGGGGGGGFSGGGGSFSGGGASGDW